MRLDRGHCRIVRGRKAIGMNNDNNFTYKNVVPIRKSERFGAYLGKVTTTGEIIEGESVGIAFMKPGSKKFRLKLFVFPGQQYFIFPDERDDLKYVILSLDEYQLGDGKIRTSWNCIGDGRLVGNFISMRIH